MAQKIIIVSLLLACFSSVASARIMVLPSPDRFQKQVRFTVEGIVTPKVVQYKTIESLGDFVALRRESTGEFIPHRLQTNHQAEPWSLPITSASPLIEGNLRALQDQSLSTAVTFASQNRVKEILFTNPENKNLSVLNLNLGDNTQAPESISLQAKVRGQAEWQTIIDRQSFRYPLRFPEIQPTELRLQIESPNLLRISELEWTTAARSDLKVQTISFYAEEGETYTLFSQPSFGQKVIRPITNTPTQTDATTPEFNLPPTERHEQFDIDFDDDGIPDTRDLCPRTPDNKNLDQDKNGRGDACEDPDQDGLYSATDNCPFTPNRDQSDVDKDGLGDVCDSTEDRFSEQSGWWINLSFGIMVLVLLLLIARVAWPKKSP
jgi:hypothetical protein